MVPGRLRFTLFQATLGRRTGLPASHAGVADVSSTPGQLSVMAWMQVIIESMVGPRQTRCWSLRAVICMEGIVCPMEAIESSCVCSGGGRSDGSLWRALESRAPTPPPSPLPPCLLLSSTWQEILRKIRFSKSLEVKIRETKDLSRNDLRCGRASRPQS